MGFCLTDRERSIKEKIITNNRPVELPDNNTVIKYRQDTSHFQLNNSKIEFQKIYKYPGDVSTIKNEILSLGIFTEILSTTDTRIIGNLKPAAIPYKELGLKYMTTSMLATKVKISGLAVIVIKDEYYRITLRNIILNGENIEISSSLSNGTKMSQNLEMGGSIEEFVVNKDGGFKNFFKKDIAEIYEYTIDKLFEPKPIDENW